MNKKGVTILELLISVSLVSVVILLLLKVMLSLENINNDPTYASLDEIKRVTIVKNIESDFLALKLNGLNIKKEKEETSINFNFQNTNKSLIIKKDKLIYDKETYTLESNNATYDLNPSFKYIDLDNNYYLIKISIPVLIDNKNTYEYDDIVLTYLDLKKDNKYPTE